MGSSIDVIIAAAIAPAMASKQDDVIAAIAMLQQASGR
jgi:hypothetical protein